MIVAKLHMDNILSDQKLTKVSPNHTIAKKPQVL